MEQSYNFFQIVPEYSCQVEGSAEQVLSSAELTRQGVGIYWVGHKKLLNVEGKWDKETKMSSRTVEGVWIFTAKGGTLAVFRGN